MTRAQCFNVMCAHSQISPASPSAGVDTEVKKPKILLVKVSILRSGIMNANPSIDVCNPDMQSLLHIMIIVCCGK